MVQVGVWPRQKGERHDRPDRLPTTCADLSARVILGWIGESVFGVAQP
jgi:hypothetical protein